MQEFQNDRAAKHDKADKLDMRGYIFSPVLEIKPLRRKAVAGPARPHSFEVVDSVVAAISVLVVWGVLRSGIHVQ